MEEFKTKCVRFGILDGTKVQEVFDRALEVMRGGGETSDAAAKNLHLNGPARKRLLSRMEEIQETLVSVSEPVARRRLILAKGGSD